MGFPTINTADTQSGTVTSNTNPWVLTYPTNLVAGDLILAFIGIDGNPSPQAGFPANWIANGGTVTAATLTWAKKISLGSETGTFNVTLGASEQGGWRTFRIPAATWQGTIGTSFTNDVNSGAVCALTPATGATANPDCGALDPSTWTTEDTLWIAAMGCDTSRTVSAFPTNCPDLRTSDVSGGSTGASLGLAMASSAVSSFNPDAWTISSSDDWVSTIVGVRGTPSIPNPPVGHRRSYHQITSH